MSLYDPKHGWDPQLIDHLFAAMWARHHRLGRQVTQSLDGALNRMQELGGLPKEKPKRVRGRPRGKTVKARGSNKDAPALTWMSSTSRDEGNTQTHALAKRALEHNAKWRTRPNEPPHDSDIRRLARKFGPEVRAKRRTLKPSKL